MSIIDEHDVTTAELSEELIFLIAAVSTDAQRKRAIELFRRFSRLTEAEAFRRGQASMVDRIEPTATPTVPALPPSLPPDHLVSLIPPIRWQD